MPRATKLPHLSAACAASGGSVPLIVEAYAALNMIVERIPPATSSCSSPGAHDTRLDRVGQHLLEQRDQRHERPGRLV